MRSAEGENKIESLNSEEIKITEEDMKNFFHKFLAIFIIGCILVIIFRFLLGFYFDVFKNYFVYIGILFFIIGLYGLIIYKFKPETLKVFLKKRKKHEKKVSESGGLRKYEIGIVVFLIGVSIILGAVASLFLISHYLFMAFPLIIPIGVIFMVIGVGYIIWKARRS